MSRVSIIYVNTVQYRIRKPPQMIQGWGNSNNKVIDQQLKKIMKIFFWDFQDDNDYIRQWLLFSINIVVLIFTTVALYRTWRYYRECMFEMMPLSINLIATFILLNLKLFEKGYQFDQIGHFIEIFTYFLFCYTFAIMYTVISQPEHRKKVQKIWNIVMAILSVLLLTVSTLVFTGVISKKCDQDTEQLPAIVGLVFQFLSFIPTGYYGTKILSKMIKKQKLTPGIDSQLGSFTSQIYIRQRKKQILLVLVVYVISLIIRFCVSIITIFMWDDLFDCSQIDGVYIITSDFASGQVILIFSEISQLLPHIVIPIAMYVIPLRRMGKNKDIKLEQGLIDEEEDYYHDDEDAQNKVSSLLSSRLSEGSPKRKNNRDPRLIYSDVVTTN